MAKTNTTRTPQTHFEQIPVEVVKRVAEQDVSTGKKAATARAGIALEQDFPITTEEFHTLNRCLDTAIAEAVTEHARITAESRSIEEFERSGQLVHEIRDHLNTAVLAFQTLKRGTVAVNGGTGMVLGRSLMNLRDLVDNALSDIRLTAKIHHRERVPVADFLSELAIAGNLHAESRAVQLAIDPVDPRLAVYADPQLLSSSVMNLLTNAFKYTHAGGQVVLRARHEQGRVHLEVEDQCGGIPEGADDPFKAFTPQRQKDRTGLGLGLSIARKAVRMHGGDIYFRNLPGKGCVFVIDMPLAAADAPVPVGA